MPLLKAMLTTELSCRFPTVLAICHGDVEVREAYSGELKPDKLRDFVLKFAGGRRCSKRELSPTSLFPGAFQLMHLILTASTSSSIADGNVVIPGQLAAGVEATIVTHTLFGPRQRLLMRLH